jgi:raffinose/stachyose/melibiose transport system permease protein
MDNRSISIAAKIVVYLVMSIFVVLAVYPIFWLVIQSFKTTQEYMNPNYSKLAFPNEWFFGNYSFVWVRMKFHTFFINSIIYSVITVISVVLLANMAGYAFAKIKFGITKLLHGIFIVGILLTIQSILIPLFLMVNAVGLYDTRLGVLIPYIGLGLPMGIYLCTDFIKRGIPDELIEAARIDGAGFFRIFVRVVFPMCTPVSVTLAIITFTATWNEFILMNLLTGSDKYRAIPAAVGRFAGSLGSDYGKLFTALAISVIPIIAFYLVFRNQITKGVAAGSVKG